MYRVVADVVAVVVAVVVPVDDAVVMQLSHRIRHASFMESIWHSSSAYEEHSSGSGLPLHTGCAVLVTVVVPVVLAVVVVQPSNET